MSSETITNLAAWRRKNRGTFVTSDGMEFTIRANLKVENLVAQGIVPASLIATLEGMSREGASDQELLRHLDEVLPMLDAVFCAAAISPRVITAAEAERLIDAVWETFDKRQVDRAQVVAALDQLALGEPAEVLEAEVLRWYRAQQYAGAVLVSEIPFADRMRLFTEISAAGRPGGVTGPAAFPVAAG